jgi:hypothetical protein
MGIIFALFILLKFISQLLYHIYQLITLILLFYYPIFLYNLISFQLSYYQIK